MNLISFLSSVNAPKSLWVTLINWIHESVGSLGWTIILVTILIKLVTTPLDFWVKFNTKKQTLIQQKCSPQVAKLQKKFGNDRQTLQVQSQALYKREGLDMRSGCIVMLINTILSFVIFITFYNDLQKVSAYEAIHQYEQIETTYYQEFTGYSDIDEFETKADVVNWFTTYNNMEDGAAKIAEYNRVKPAIERANASASIYWENNKSRSSWLWVQNIWVADSTAKAFPSYKGLVSIAKSTGYTSYVKDNIVEADYDRIATVISDNAPRQNNGYFILPVLAGVVTFLSQYITELHTRLKNKKANQVAKEANSSTNSTLKVMKIVMPAIMVIFTLSASASFGLYILASNISTMALGEITTVIINAMTKKKRLEVEAELEKEANRLIKKGKFKE